MSDIVIEVENASKLFKLYHNPITGPVKEILFPWQRNKYYESFWAVKDVNMQVKRGEVVGIIGPNGAGKTTLLKMIAGLLPVEKGRITVRGKITALLALGIGVHPEFSGRENILYGAMLLGMPKQEVLNKMEEIVEFAELGDFINHPFRTYSSGMKARLLFAISMSVEPDILIVDEALATGDSYFLAKSRSKILELCNSGATILFVSHNLQQIEELCQRAFLINFGCFVDESTPDKIIKRYKRLIFENAQLRINSNESKDTDSTIIEDNKCSYNNFDIMNVEIISENNEPKQSFATGDVFCIKLYYFHNYNESIDVNLNIQIYSAESHDYVALIRSQSYVDGSTSGIKTKTLNLSQNGVIILKMKQILLARGHYYFKVKVHRKSKSESKYKIIYEKHKKYYFFSARAHCPMNRGPHIWHPVQIKYNSWPVVSKAGNPQPIYTSSTS